MGASKRSGVSEKCDRPLTSSTRHERVFIVGPWLVQGLVGRRETHASTGVRVGRAGLEPATQGL